MKKTKSIIINLMYMMLILVAAFMLSLTVGNVFRTDSLIPAIFTLAVFLISIITGGYIYGVIGSILSVLALNYAFAFPYFKFNFSISENLVSAIIMLIITVISSTLIIQVKQNEKTKAEAEKEKMRANLLRAISHDLRSPLTTIYGSSAVIIEKHNELSKEQSLKLVKGINEDSQWLISMVENLLSVTKIDSGNVKLNKIPTVLEELIDAVLVKFRKRYPAQRVIVDIPDEFVTIPMDALLIEQVIVNILENAVQHAKGMSELILRCFVVGENAIFEIIDDGCGIAKERMNNLFTGYYVSENTDAPVDVRKKGMGIGLSVCASIIKAHEGTISAENRKTKGSCFRFSLKMEAEDNEQ